MSKPMLAVWVALLLAACGDSNRAGDTGPSSGIRFLADAETDDDGFARAMAPREFVFPRDHGSHPDYRTEWWYFTGNLENPTQGHYGFELTFFRIGLVPERPTPRTAWATGQIWMAHFALTDTEMGHFAAFERLSRGALELAGATASPFEVWVEDWSARAPTGRFEDGIALTAAAHGGGPAIELHLVPARSPVAQGRRGLDAKGPEPGNASFYYSVPRLEVSGSVRRADGRLERVEGLAWMDREWGTSQLSPGLEGWDWFALQLDDGRDLMLYRLREADGATSAFSAGSLVSTDGTYRTLESTDFTLTPTRHWQSPESGARYPVDWRLELPEEALTVTIEPKLDAQELRLSVRYWEGAVTIEGESRGRRVGGRGYMELAGY